MLGRLALVPDLSGALWLPDERTLVVADLHLEKGSAYAARGVFLPPYDSAATLAALTRRDRCATGRAASSRSATAFTIAAGQARLDRRAAARRWRGLQQGRDWLWITGNHDPQHRPGARRRQRGGIEIAGVALRHEPDRERRRLRDRRPSPPGGEGAGCAAGRCGGAALRCRRCAASCRRWAPMPAG